MGDDDYEKKCLIKIFKKEIMARTGVHRLENRLEREQSWQKLTDTKLGG